MILSKVKQERSAVLRENRLLQKYLTPKQQAEFICQNRIIVNGSAGGVYIVPCVSAVYLLIGYNPILCYSGNGGKFIRTCGAALAAPITNSTINMLGMKFELETDEAAVLELGCRPLYNGLYWWKNYHDFELEVDYESYKSS